MAQSAVLKPKDRTAICAIAAHLRRSGKHKPLLLTGKSARTAAEAIAGELGLDIYRLDLSAIVSKYIGETEKNLKRVFGQAKDSRALLFFDEADALFGKRTKVKDAHDRFANVAIDYLLERIEEHRGLVILISRSQRPLPAGLRRRLSVRQFPPPSARAG
jgi:SpoVK/Ycf46/Vps4 family AAA+-type ATPase